MRCCYRLQMFGFSEVGGISNTGLNKKICEICAAIRAICGKYKRQVNTHKNSIFAIQTHPNTTQKRTHENR